MDSKSKFKSASKPNGRNHKRARQHTLIAREEDKGIIPRCIDYLFNSRKIDSFIVKVSYIEIYNDMVIDLLELGKKQD